MSADLNNKTPGGTLAYCDYLLAKGYATATQINPWRTAVQKVFEVVDGEGWESTDLSSLDLQEHLARFQTLAGAQYKAESIASYGRRIRNALDAHEHYLSTGRPPTFRHGSKRQKADDKSASGAAIVKMDTKKADAHLADMPISTDSMLDFPYPLGDGRMVALRLPRRLKSDDVNRLCAFIRTLQDDSPEQRQISRQAGDEQQAA